MRLCRCVQIYVTLEFINMIADSSPLGSECNPLFGQVACLVERRNGAKMQADWPNDDYKSEPIAFDAFDALARPLASYCDSPASRGPNGRAGANRVAQSLSGADRPKRLQSGFVASLWPAGRPVSQNIDAKKLDSSRCRIKTTTATRRRRRRREKGKIN